jgi:hypothetical protein
MEQWLCGGATVLIKRNGRGTYEHFMHIRTLLYEPADKERVPWAPDKQIATINFDWQHHQKYAQKYYFL